MKLFRYSLFGAAVIAVWLAGHEVAGAAPLIQHDLTVRLEPSRQWMQAKDRVTISGPERSLVEFDLARHLNVGRVTLNDRSVDHSFNNGRLRINLPAGNSAPRLQIHYSGVFNDEVPVEPLNTDNPGYGVSGIISDRGTMLLAGARWYPQAGNTVSSYRIAINAPEGVVAVTAGTPLGQTTDKGRTITRWEVPHPIRGIPLVAGPYTVTTRRFGAVTAATNFTSPLQPLSNGYLDATGRYLRLYEELFGPYPHGQFAVVENFFPTGYGFPSFTLLGRRVLQLPFIKHTSLGHEIAHSWWGNGVLVDGRQGNWSEGLTTYVADYLYKERRGQGRDHRLQWLRNYAALIGENNDFPPSAFSSRTDPATKVVGYDKVAMIFHMLRRTVGEDNFWQALRDIYGQHRFSAIVWSDLQAAFERRAGRSLDHFFRQWVFRPGAPDLALADVEIVAKDQGYVLNGIILQKKPYFELDMDLVVATEGDSVTQTVRVSGAQSPFSIAAAHRPRRVEADPGVHLWRRLSPEEVPPTVNSLKGAVSVNIIVNPHRDSGWVEIARRFAKALGLNHVRIGTAGDFSPTEMSRNDLLFIGRPHGNKWLPAVGGAFSLKGNAVILNGVPFSGAGTSFFGVFRHPDDASRVMALFIPGRHSLAERVSTKIPHYGKYSYLVFSDGQNTRKGTWAADRSPLVVRWSQTPNGGRP